MTDPTAINIAICEALGLDPTRIAKDGVRITLDGHLGPVVEVTYRYFIDGNFITALKSYKLVPIDQGDA